MDASNMKVVFFALFVAEALSFCTLKDKSSEIWPILKDTIDKSNIHNFNDKSYTSVNWTQGEPIEDYRWHNFIKTFDGNLTLPFKIGLSLRLQDRSTIYLNGDPVVFTAANEDDVNEFRKGLWRHFQLIVTAKCFPLIIYNKQLNCRNKTTKIGANRRHGDNINLKINDTYNEWKIHKYDVIEIPAHKNNGLLTIKTSHNKLIYFSLKGFNYVNKMVANNNMTIKLPSIKNDTWTNLMVSCTTPFDNISLFLQSGQALYIANEFYGTDIPVKFNEKVNEIPYFKPTTTTTVKPTTKQETTTIKQTKINKLTHNMSTVEQSTKLSTSWLIILISLSCVLMIALTIYTLCKYQHRKNSNVSRTGDILLKNELYESNFNTQFVTNDLYEPLETKN